MAEGDSETDSKKSDTRKLAQIRRTQIAQACFYWLVATVVVLWASNKWLECIAEFLTSFPSSVAEFCHKAPYIVGLLAMMLIWLGHWLSSGALSPLPLIQGADGRLSTSKAQLFFWTVVAIFSYVSYDAALIGAGHREIGKVELPGNLIAAMGLSLGTATVAYAITARQVARGELAKPPAESATPQGGLVTDDKGDVDLQKAQMMAWTFIAMLAYLANLGREIHQITVHGIPVINGIPAGLSFPDIDSSLMILMGLGQGSYLGSKLILDGSPVLETVASASAGSVVTVTLTGKNLGTALGSLLISGAEPGPGVAIKTWTDTSISFTIAPESKLGGALKVSVLSKGKESNALDLQVVRKPQIATIEAVLGRDGTPLLLVKGLCFGDPMAKGAMLKVGGKQVVDALLWLDMSISGKNPDPDTLKASAPIKVEIYMTSEVNAPPTVAQTLTIT